jgi:hypothetical protein
LFSCPSGWRCKDPQLREFSQCGGKTYSGLTLCEQGTRCYKQNKYYSQCLRKCPGTEWDCDNTSQTTFTAGKTSTSVTPATLASNDITSVVSKTTATNKIPLNGQCGGLGFKGSYFCETGIK